MIRLCKKLYTINRSITGPGVRESLQVIRDHGVPLEVFSVESGTKVFDWKVPPEWRIKDAYVIDTKTGKKVIDFKKHNLHVVSYSVPVNEEMSFSELDKNLYHIKSMPTAIPYTTSYYKKRWGFCLSYDDYKNLNRDSRYRVVVDSELDYSGQLNYGEVIIPGASEAEVMFSTYICHPQMCNNELSGPAVWAELVKHVMNLEHRKYTYRFVIAPETIGSITYISRNIDILKKNVVAAFNLTCVGDERCFSYVPSRKGNTYSDRVAKLVLDTEILEYKEYTWLDRGSDERQYCSPGVDIPMCSITRSKFGEYPEYHTSLDNFDLISEKGLQESLEVHKNMINIIEKNCKPVARILCEPNLGSRGLYPTINTAGPLKKTSKQIKNFLSYCDGDHDLIGISTILGIDFETCVSIFLTLKEKKLITIL
jgi:aminopeptidase-like protein